MNEYNKVRLLLERSRINEAKGQIEKYRADQDINLHTLMQAKLLLSENKSIEAEALINSINLREVKDVKQRTELSLIKDFLKVDLKILTQKNTKEAIRDLLDLQSQYKENEFIKEKLASLQKPSAGTSRSDEERIRFTQLYRESAAREECTKWFVISTEWFLKWKVHVGFKETASCRDLPFNSLWSDIRCDNPGIIDNSMIIDLSSKDDFAPDEKSPGFYVLKPGLAENTDFVLVPEPAFDLLHRRYSSKQSIIRNTISTTESVKVEVYLKKLSLGFIYKENFQVKTHYISRNCIIQDIIVLLLKEINIKIPKNFEDVKVWKIDTAAVPIKQILAAIKSKRNPIYLENSKILEETLIIEEAEISDDNILLLDHKFSKDFLISPDKSHSLFSKSCVSCTNPCESTFLCKLCSKPFCSKPCLSSHSSVHSKPHARKSIFNLFSCFCVKNDPDDEKIISLSKTLPPAYSQSSTSSTSPSSSLNSSLKGLQNLGNTCFMNSAIQCLVHSEDIRRFFISGDYLKKINKQNPLGTKGKLAMAYGDLLNSMCSASEKSVAPWGLKKTIAVVASQFEGYQQHDSHEFLSYLINGLHEDLNEVTKKPYYDSDIRFSNDREVAEESWRRHESRNRSIIAELMYGQYKSTLHCPKCSKYSYAFDPFNCLSLPIPHIQQKTFEVSYLPYETNREALLVNCAIDSQSFVLDLKKQVAEAVSGEFSELLVFEVKPSSILSQVSDTDIVNLQRPANYYVYQVPRRADSYLFLCIVLDNYGRETCPRILEFDIGADASEILDCIYEKFIELFAKSEVNLSRSSVQEVYRVMAYSTRAIVCFNCGESNCRKCEVLKDNKKLSGYLAKADLPMLKIVFGQGIKQKVDLTRLTGFKKCKGPGHSSKGKQISLDDCFRTFSLPEVLDKSNLWYCPYCKAHVQASKQLEIYRVPKILIIHLKRFRSIGFHREKLNLPIRFPREDLDISRFVMGENPEKYDLYAVSNHFGSLSGGHYTATVHNGGRWYDCDDSHITETKDVSETSAYVLFYRAKNSANT